MKICKIFMAVILSCIAFPSIAQKTTLDYLMSKDWRLVIDEDDDPYEHNIFCFSWQDLKILIHEFDDDGVYEQSYIVNSKFYVTDILEDDPEWNPKNTYTDGRYLVVKDGSTNPSEIIRYQIAFSESGAKMRLTFIDAPNRGGFIDWVGYPKGTFDEIK